MMTRKHYKRVAEILGATCTNKPQLLKQINEFCLWFKADNYRFQRHRFHNYAVDCYEKARVARNKSKKMVKALADVAANGNICGALAEGPNL